MPIVSASSFKATTLRIDIEDVEGNMTTEFRSTELGESRVPRPSFASLIETLLRQPNIDAEFSLRLQAVEDYLLTPPPGGGPFLTVLLRTQGKRLELLKDALLCLSAQTDEDFEVIVLDHDAEKVDAEELSSVVDSQPQRFRERVRILEVSGGTRATPLNRGLDAARGRYVAVFDDDDLMFANWVEEFHHAAAIAPGRLLRAIVANQQLVPEKWPQGEEGFRTLSWPKAEYAKKFKQLDHLEVNHSPFMTWAFPRILFTRYGLRFDEKLLVCEDWDMILRGSLILGVTDVSSLTSIYRRWLGGESSYTIHSSEVWRSSEARVIGKLDRDVIMLPAGAVSEIRQMIRLDDLEEHYDRLLSSTSWRLTAPLRFGLRSLRLIWRRLRVIYRRFSH